LANRFLKHANLLQFTGPPREGHVFPERAKSTLSFAPDYSNARILPVLPFLLIKPLFYLAKSPVPLIAARQPHPLRMIQSR
jgi:hypothetical protein